MPRIQTSDRDRNKPVIGEARSVRELEYRYSIGLGGLTKPTEHAGDAVSTFTAGRAPSKIDTNLLDVLKVACTENGRPEWRIKYQSRGTCVGQAAATAADMVMAVSWLVFDNEFPGRASVAAMYAGSRVESAGRPGWWDGSNGSWVAKWVRQWGVLLLEELDLPDTSRWEDERLGVRWAASRSGVPSGFEDTADERPILLTPFVETTDEAALAIESGSPIVDCSNLIPTGRTDRRGMSPVRRSGGHATVFAAVRWRDDGDPEFLYLNSWSEDWGDEGMVWISQRDAQAILNQNDSYAFTGVGGLEPLPGGLL